MTPEERAGEMYLQFSNVNVALRDAIAAAIRDAVKAEREACADIAATHFGYRDDNSADLTGATIANRIRERTP